jgi:hypothetical protein
LIVTQSNRSLTASMYEWSATRLPALRGCDPAVSTGDGLGGVDGGRTTGQPPGGNVCSVAVVSGADLVGLQRSAAMHQPGQQVAVEREVLLALCEELVEQRALLRRLGGDLRTVARRASAQDR